MVTCHAIRIVYACTINVHCFSVIIGKCNILCQRNVQHTNEYKFTNKYTICQHLIHTLLAHLVIGVIGKETRFRQRVTICLHCLIHVLYVIS